MKIKNILSLLIVFISINAIAQQKREQIKSLKVAFITSELELTTDEAEKFWPIYNAYEEKQHDIKKQKLKGYLDRMDDEALAKLSEKEAANIISQMENSEEELYLAKRKFTSSLKGVIPAIKILKLKKAEEKFNRKLLQQYRDRKRR